MLVFADNDILIKLAGSSLLERFLEALGNPAVCIARTTRFSLPKQAGRNIKDPTRVAKLCHWLDSVSDAGQVQNLDLLDRLSETPNIDSGESTLLASLCECADDSALITGDKRALRALLANQPRLPEVFEKLSGSVYTLESSMLLLIEQYGFAEIDETMKARAVDDKVLNMAFGAGRNSEHAKQCLSSSIRDVLPLLANPELILPCEEF